MNRVEAVRAAQKIGGSLRGAADAAGLDDELGLDAHLEHGLDDALGNRIVAASSAERGFSALVVDDGEADAVGLWPGCRGSGLNSRGRHSVAFPQRLKPQSNSFLCGTSKLVPFPNPVSRTGVHLPSMLVNSSVMDRASSGSPVMWAMLRRRQISSGFTSSLSRLSICASRFCSTT